MLNEEGCKDSKNNSAENGDEDDMFDVPLNDDGGYKGLDLHSDMTETVYNESAS